MNSPARSNANYFRHFGFSLIEVILVVALLSILAASTVAFGSSLLARVRFDSTVQMVSSTIRKAQAYSMAGKDSSLWGVCLTGQNLRLYRGGTCAAPIWREDYVVVGSITITGLNDIVFSSPRGEPSAATTIDISNNLKTTSLSLSWAGGLSAP